MSWLQQIKPEWIWAACALFAGAGIVWLWLRSQLAQTQAHLDAVVRERDRLNTDLAQNRSELARLQSEAVSLETRLEAEQRHAQEKLRLLTESREELTNQFKTLSQEILEDKTKRFTESNKSNMEELLKPVRERFSDFQKQVHETYNQEARDRTELKAEIRNLKSLHEQMSDDAKRLTNALKGDTKAQGGWGEVILKRVFEASGLREGFEYDLQVNMQTEDGGRLIPDAVVHMPEGRDVVVDAKVSLTAYERLHHDEAATEAEQKREMNEHVRSVRAHVDRLSGKDYQQLASITTLDFVLMFIPVEGAYIEAMRADPGLHDYALRKNVVLLSPSNMLPTLRVVEHMWRVDKQNRNALTIADEAGKLYDKFVLFVKDVEDIGQRLEQAQTAYGNAHNKLSSGRGALVGRAEKLKKLGAKAAKQLGEDTRTSALESDEED